MKRPEGVLKWLDRNGPIKGTIGLRYYITQLEDSLAEWKKEEILWKEREAGLLADKERLDQFFIYGTALMDLKEDKPTAGRVLLIHACVPMNRAAYDAKVKVLKKGKEHN